MLYVPKVNCMYMYLRYRDAFAGRTFLLLVFLVCNLDNSM